MNSYPSCLPAVWAEVVGGPMHAPLRSLVLDSRSHLDKRVATIGCVVRITLVDGQHVEATLTDGLAFGRIRLDKQQASKLLTAEAGDVVVVELDIKRARKKAIRFIGHALYTSPRQ